MRTLLIILLILFAFCEIQKLEKEKTIVFKTDGMFYLNIEEYDIMDEINILFTLKNGDMKQLIQLEFNDTIPTKDYDLAQNRGPSSSAYAYYSTSSGIHGTIKYYYEIKKYYRKNILLLNFLV